jgi:SET domain-containing protein
VWEKGLSLFSNKEFKKGDKVIYMKGKLVDAKNSTPEAVQMTEKKFIDTKYLVLEDFINHSCSPNTKLDTVHRWFIALKNIKKNEEITFNYLTTEWDMKRWGTDFECLCNSKKCFKHIKGFKYLSYSQKLKLKPLLSPPLLKKSHN